MSWPKRTIYAGIYFIQIDGTDLFYIGEGWDVYQRWGNHLWLLRKGKHYNKKIQKAYDEFGESAFSFIIYEDGINNEKLRVRYEQFLIYKFKAISGGLNIQKRKGWVDPQAKEFYIKNFLTGEEVRGTNVTKFARDMGESTRGFTGIVSGKYKFNNCWYCPDLTEPPDPHVLISPEGKTVEFIITKYFCEDYGLNYDCIRGLLSGRFQISQGWTRPNSIAYRKSSNRIFEFTNPNGRIISGKNVEQFCKDNKLNPNKIRSLLNCTISEYKGWKLTQSFIEKDKNLLKHLTIHKLPKEGRYFDLKNIKTNEIVVGNNIKLFCNDRKISIHSIYRLLYNQTKTSKDGWMLNNA